MMKQNLKCGKKESGHLEENGETKRGLSLIGLLLNGPENC